VLETSPVAKRGCQDCNGSSTGNAGGAGAPYRGYMPYRKPIDPQGWYHVSSRGCYGRTLFANAAEHELFLRRYARVARKYGWGTPAWALMKNHHHFVIALSEGGLSEGMRELHGGYSRTIHQVYGQTRQGHLFRHAFFARQLESESDLLTACAYLDLNATRAGVATAPETSQWSGYRATVGTEFPRVFHLPSLMLQFLHRELPKAQDLYRRLVEERLVLRGPGPTPNDEVGRMVESAA
jgi:REP element-mobilizing transposase RayT